MTKSEYETLKNKRLIYDTIPFREKFMMKSEDTLDWYPAQLPPVKIILGEAVLAVGKQGRPINTRTLLEYLQVMQDKQKRRDDKIAMQTAIDVLRDNQRINGRRWCASGVRVSSEWSQPNGFAIEKDGHLSGNQA